MGGAEPIGAPFPDIACNVVETEAVGVEGLDRCGAEIAVGRCPRRGPHNIRARPAGCRSSMTVPTARLRPSAAALRLVRP